MTKFHFKGSIAASKSLMNRALMLQTFFPFFQVIGKSNCDDVIHMQKAVTQLSQKREIECGDAGTVLRFMGVRVSRDVAVTRLRGSPRLLSRPQEDLAFILSQLGVQVNYELGEIMIESKGWKKPLVPVRIHREKSSQFATGILFSAWNLPFALELELTPVGLHDSYWNMSLAMAESLGMVVEKLGRDRYRIPPNQQVNARKIEIEPDYSSMFSIATLAALGGEARFENVRSQSWQPDYAFIEMMKAMKIPIMLEGTTLGVLKAPRIVAQDIIMRDTPDLFPVLAVLMAHADGTSHLSGAPRLIHKESNRIKKTAELLDLMRIENEVLQDGIRIEGKGLGLRKTVFAFDPDKDHRMAMAAGILQRLGWEIDLKSPEVVNKSFPEFWSILGLKP